MLRQLKIIGDIKSAEVLIDPIRRQILELLAEEEMTEAAIAKRLEFSQASISHHMKELSRAHLVEIARTEAEAHGILQKFYRASARLIMVDYEKMPYSIRRYTLALYIERVRGALAALAHGNQKVKLTRGDIEVLSDALAKQVVTVARELEKDYGGSSREEMILAIYSAALSRVAASPEGAALELILNAPVVRRR